MGLIDMTMKNILVSENYQNSLLLIASTIIFQLILSTPTENTPHLDEVDDGEIVSTCLTILHLCKFDFPFL